jgi:hypothetical protein
MGRKSKGTKKAATGPTISKIEKYEDTLEEGGVDDCELSDSRGGGKDTPLVLGN